MPTQRRRRVAVHDRLLDHRELGRVHVHRRVPVHAARGVRDHGAGSRAQLRPRSRAARVGSDDVPAVHRQSRVPGQTASAARARARNCGINGSTCRANQNSVTLLKERARQRGDAVAPTMQWTSPGEQRDRAARLRSQGHRAPTTSRSPAQCSKIDGAQTDMKTGAGPYMFVTSATLPEGMHTRSSSRSATARTSRRRPAP